MTNCYKEVLKESISRLLSLYNLDANAPTYGYGDRINWGWKVSDFANGTLQGGVHSLAIIIKLGLFPNENFLLMIIDSAIRAISRIRRKNGSMEEAYPYESSFCVTALVAFDVLSAIKLLGDKLSDDRRQDYLEIIRPLIGFITKNDEEHAIISNHLATGAAAIARWNLLSGEQNPRSTELLDVIYRHQSEEGWYQEYEGADPGYQTLATYYLAAVYEDTQDDRLLKSLERSAAFLKYFIHPGGTIGGLYGSRNTEVLYPGGIVALSDKIADFAIMAKAIHQSIVDGRHIYPGQIDIGNFVPLLNAYAYAAWKFESRQDAINQADPVIPAQTEFRKNWPGAGIYAVAMPNYYALVNYKKGGTMKVFDKNTGTLDLEDGGIFCTMNNGRKCSTQQYDERIDFEQEAFTTTFYVINESLPSPVTTIILRLLGITVFRSLWLGNVFKKLIVRRLMTGKRKAGGSVQRKFQFNDDRILVTEEIHPPSNASKAGHMGKVKAIHMASSGYYLPQMAEQPDQSKYVTFQ